MPLGKSVVATIKPERWNHCRREMLLLDEKSAVEKQ